ncbi:protoglobin domain-containing protein [Candidatus Leptofilum sp.]|uniref:protoglobin domain-containing protein n=1 Tax=Candidatus Leptofilum sp. TaxID=3241576 RepID=UPI003B59DB2C
MESFATINGQIAKYDTWQLSGLAPAPEEEWDRLQSFLGLGKPDFEAMLATVEPLFRRGHELVVGTYDYLLNHHDTAVILGWEKGADAEHLAERRRFFTVWLARTLGLDLSHDFAHYLFRAGQIHAAHGPRQIHVPQMYVTGSISLVNATFARFLLEEMPGNPIVPTALASWNKLLNLHLHLMLLGYETARAWDDGDFPVELSFFGRVRNYTGRQKMTMHLPQDSRAETLLVRFFNYFPQMRPDVLAVEWLDKDRLDEQGRPWLVLEKRYWAKKGWRVLLNGRNISFEDGPNQMIKPGDTVSIFPPGR